MQWGPAGWKFLHTITFAYPDQPTLQQQRSATDLFTSLQDMLPCPACQGHYQEFLKQNPIPVSNAVDLQKWLVNLHNSVNQRLQKPLVTYEQAKQMYTTPTSESKASPTLVFVVLGLFVLLMILITVSSVAQKTNSALDRFGTVTVNL